MAKRLGSWDLYSPKDESVVHLLLPGARWACKPNGWPARGVNKDTLAHNMRKRPCPDCLYITRRSLEARQRELDIEKNRLAMFSRLSKSTED